MEKSEIILTTKQAAKLVKRTPANISNLIKTNRLKAYKNGLRWCIYESDLRDYYKRRYSRKFSTYDGQPLFDKTKGEYSAAEAGIELKLTTQMVYHYMRSKKLPFKKKGMSYVIQIEDINMLKGMLGKNSKLPLRKS